MISVSFCYLFQTINKWMERSKHGFFLFPPKKTLIWRRHSSITQSCCSMTWKRSIDWYLESSREWSFFYGSVCLTNQKPRAFVSVRLLFLFCSRVFISRSYENRSNPTLKTNHYDTIRLQTMNSTTRGMLDYQSLFRKRARARLLSWGNKIEPERLAEIEPSLEEGYG